MSTFDSIAIITASLIAGIGSAFSLIQLYSRRIAERERDAIERSFQRQTAALERRLESRLANLSNDYIDIRSEHRILPTDSSDLSDQRIVSELAHSLRTPLNAIRARAAIAQSKIPASGPGWSDISDVIAFADICETILATFRQLLNVSRRADQIGASSVGEAIQLLHSMSNMNSGKQTLLDTSIGHFLEEPPVGYLTTLLLPIIENAVEASPPDGLIRVKVRESMDYLLIEVVNDCESTISRSRLLAGAPGTSKLGHEGLGLAVARRLAELRRGGAVKAFIEDDDRVRIEIRIPQEPR